MPSLRPEDLHTCTVKLSIDGGHGTGFFVSSGLILTCHHVVKNAGDRPIKVRWQNQENFAVATVLQSFPDPVDLALLQFETVEALACVELDGAIAAFDDLFAYGYPDIDPNGAGVVLRCDGLNGDEPPKIKFSDGRVRSGLSGAPLLNPVTGKVCGVVKYTEDRSLPLGGGGIPIATVLEYFPVLNTPYKGLAYFKDDDARFFFGRTALTDLLLDRLQQSNFLALLGASGSGKSSVLRAGLLNQLRQGRLSGSDRWELRVMLPTEHPLKSLANEFVDQKLGNIDRAAQLATAEKLLSEGKDGLRRLVEATAKTTRMVLVIDQFEESFTLCQNLEEREQFFACLIGALEIAADKFCLAIAMRADFFGKCVEREYGGLSKRIAAHLVAVTPMNDDELREAISKPAEIVGCEVEPILIEEIVRDVAGAPANLPLMQFALSELWQLRDGNRLTLQAYKQELGGITGALEKRANAVYAQFTDELDKRAVKHIFLSLTQLGEGTEDTRRRVVMSNLVTATLSLEAIERVVRKLADEKLVVTDDREKGKVSGDAIVDVAHEALIRGWRLLRGWLDEDRQNLQQQRWIEDRAIEWQNSGKVKEFLLSGRQLKESRKFQKQQVDRFPLSELVQQLLKVSRHQEKIGLAFVVTIYAMIPIVLGGFAIRWWYLETKWAVLRQCEIEKNEDGKCTGRLEALKTLIEANISLQAIDLRNTNLSKADLRYANFSRADLNKADLSNANLIKANLSNVDLRKANLIEAKLSDADLSNSYIMDAKLINADLSNANLNRANLSRASLWYANLSNANLSNTALINTNLNYANLSYANLSNANFMDANLTNTDLSNADLSYAELSFLAKFDSRTIKTACNWETAKMSEELREQIGKAPDPKLKPDCRRWNKSP
jgi:uncharacterized protein YjbI with pentapeptide repeats